HVGHPIADRLVHRVLQRSAARVDLADLGAQQFHAEHVRLLPAHVDTAHVHDAFEPEQRARGRARDAVLTGPGLGDDASLAHALGEEGLTDRAVDLVRAGVREVLSLEEDARETDRRCEARGVGERRGPTDPVAQHSRQLGLKFRIRTGLEPCRFELGHGGHERLGQVLPAELAVAPGPRLRDHACTARLIDAMLWMSGDGSSARISAVPMSTASTRAGSMRASSTEAMPDSATRIWSRRTKALSCRTRPMSISIGRRRLRAFTPTTAAPLATARPNAAGSCASTRTPRPSARARSIIRRRVASSSASAMSSTASAPAA